MGQNGKHRVLVTAFSDYICPFCYVGSNRLQRLNEDFDIKVNWCFVEIHPDSPPEGRPLEGLGYAAESWHQMMANLDDMAREEGLALNERTFTTNSRKALLLAESAKEEGRKAFYCLHERLFEAYFAEGLNIGDPGVLRDLAAECGLGEAVVNRAWSESRYAQRLEQNLALAGRIRLTGVPTYVVGNSVLAGAVPIDQLREAARAATQAQS